MIGTTVAGRHQRRAVERLAVAGPEDRVADVQVEAERVVGVGRDLVDQLGGEVGVGGGRADPELDLDRAGDLEVRRPAAASGRPARRGARRGAGGCRRRGCRRAAAGRSRRWSSGPGSTRCCRRSSAPGGAGRRCRSCGSDSTGGAESRERAVGVEVVASSAGPGRAASPARPARSRRAGAGRPATGGRRRSP